MKNKGYYAGDIVFFLAFFLAFFVIWLDNEMGKIYFDQLLFHMLASSKGTSHEIFARFFNCFYPVLIIYIILMVKLFKNIPTISITIFRKKLEFFFFPFKLKNTKVHFLIGLFVLLIIIIHTMLKLHIFQYIKNQINSSSIYEENYVDPNAINLIFPENKRNLIYIYMESMESSYANYQLKSGETVNLIPNLTKLANSYINISATETFGGAYQAPLTGWTIAGIVAQSAGVNLNIPIHGNSLNNYELFMPGITTIGDILAKEGYNQEFMVGSDATFGGRRNYFIKHGNYKIFDYNYAKEIGKIDKNYLVFWGFEDKKLFTFAKEELIKLSKENNPFNFTLLTVDSHFYDGYLDNECELKYDSSYANAIYCSDKKIGEFISWIQSQDFYNNTTIILSGDHLTMNNNFFNGEATENRQIYNAIINSATSSSNTKNRKFTTLDMFPTTLASMGVQIEGNRLGLGVNLLSNEKTLIESLGESHFYKQLSLKSKFYHKFFYD